MSNVSLLGTYGDGSGSPLVFRNKLINGDMRIDQRNSGATITPTTSPAQAGYSVDRWRYFISQSSKVSFAQSSVAPAGFTSSLLCTSTSAYSVISSDVFQIGQIIEGLNVADLSWGTSDAKPVTISFWVRSSLTGLTGGSIVNVDGTRSYPFSYSVNAANTWEYKQVTVVGDTTGTWAKNNTQGLRLRFNLGSGSAQVGTAGAWAAGDYNGPTGAISLVGTSGATLYITGVQLEAGTSATPFEQRPIGMETSLCQRYCIQYGGDNLFNQFVLGFATSTTAATSTLYLPQKMRSTPTLTTAGGIQVSDGVTATGVTGISVFASGSSTQIICISLAVSSGLTAFRPIRVEAANTLATSFVFSAEL